MSRKDIFEKYYNSDIFNQSQKLSSLSYKNIKVRESQPSLIKTKDDIFHTERKNIKEEKTKSGIKRQKVYDKMYGSDIFFQNKIEKMKKKEGVKIIKKNKLSDCFEQMKNNEEYKEDIKSYTLRHRKEKEIYNPDKYMKIESAAGTYYNQMYDSEGSSIIRERPFSVNYERKKKYEINKKYLNKKIQILNDCGVDQTRKQENNKESLTEVKKYNKKEVLNNENNSIDKKDKIKRCIEFKKINPKSAYKINKRTNLTSHLFNQSERDKKLEILKSKMNNNNINKYRDDYYHISENYKRDLTNNDPKIWGAVHSKWARTKIDWDSPETEVMFGNTFTKELKELYGKKGPNAFQFMCHQMADSQNADTITEIKKGTSLVNIKRPPSERVINDEVYTKIQKVLNGIENIKEYKKNEIKNNMTTAMLNGEKNINEKMISLNKYYTNTNFDKIKVKKAIEIRDKNENNKNEFSSYVITYPIKGNFEKYNENDIKLMFGNKGLHIYDIQKNMFDKGTFNSVNLKIRVNEPEDKIQMKINEIKKDLEKKNTKVLIDKKDKKDFRKKMRHFLNDPGGKLGIMKDYITNPNANKNKLIKIPDKIRSIHSFSNEFKNVNYKYKHNKI